MAKHKNILQMTPQYEDTVPAKLIWVAIPESLLQTFALSSLFLYQIYSTHTIYQLFLKSYSPATDGRTQYHTCSSTRKKTDWLFC